MRQLSCSWLQKSTAFRARLDPAIVHQSRCLPIRRRGQRRDSARDSRLPNRACPAETAEASPRSRLRRSSALPAPPPSPVIAVHAAGRSPIESLPEAAPRPDSPRRLRPMCPTRSSTQARPQQAKAEREASRRQPRLSRQAAETSREAKRRCSHCVNAMARVGCARFHDTNACAALGITLSAHTNARHRVPMAGAGSKGSAADHLCCGKMLASANRPKRPRLSRVLH